MYTITNGRNNSCEDGGEYYVEKVTLDAFPIRLDYHIESSSYLEGCLRIRRPTMLDYLRDAAVLNVAIELHLENFRRDGVFLEAVAGQASFTYG